MEMSDSSSYSPEGSDAPLSRREQSSGRLSKRSMSWSDEHAGLELQIVHHVWDTHYRRTFWQRHMCAPILNAFAVNAHAHRSCSARTSQAVVRVPSRAGLRLFASSSWPSPSWR